MDEELEPDFTAVLDSWLPVAPTSLDVGETVPIARWVGVRFGAIRLLSREDRDGEDELSDDTQVFVRDGSSWREADADGGTAGPYRPEQFVPPARDEALFSGTLLVTQDDWACVTAEGRVSPAVAYIEVEDVDGVTRNRVESPVGDVVLCGNGTTDLAVRLLDEHGRVLRAGTVTTGWTRPKGDPPAERTSAGDARTPVRRRWLALGVVTLGVACVLGPRPVRTLGRTLATWLPVLRRDGV